MTRPAFAFLAVGLVVLCCTPRDQEPSSSAITQTRRLTCGVDSSTRLTGDGLGALRIGASVETVRTACDVVHDTTALGGEALPERTLLVDLGTDSITAVVDEDKIWRLHLDRPVFRTADSLGVGSFVTAFRARAGVEVLTGENQVFLTAADACGLSFRLGGLDAEAAPPLTSIADSIRVDEVLVIGCSRAGAGPA